jgi:hypothetical protein
VDVVERRDAQALLDDLEANAPSLTRRARAHDRP